MMRSLNSSHRPPPYFEWFYFHFVTPEGTALNMVLHETDIFGLQRAPYLSLCVKFPGQAPVYLRRDLGGVAIARGQPFLQVGDGLFAESDRTLCFDIAFPDRGHFRGEIQKLAPPLLIEEGVLHADPDTGRASHWVVAVPHATFSGILQLDGVVQRLHGTAYQDHQWGSGRIQDFVSDWVWGHFSNAQLAVVFFQILTQRGRRIERVALLDRAGRYGGTMLQTAYLDQLLQTRQPATFETVVKVSFLKRRCALEFALAPDALMRRRIDEAQDDHMASYLRWHSVAQLAGWEADGPLQGVTEYLRLRSVACAA